MIYTMDSIIKSILVDFSSLYSTEILINIAPIHQPNTEAKCQNNQNKTYCVLDSVHALIRYSFVKSDNQYIPRTADMGKAPPWLADSITTSFDDTFV